MKRIRRGSAAFNPMLRAVAWLLLAPLSAQAQVAGSCSVVPHNLATRILSKRAAQHLSIWVCGAKNNTGDKVLFTESSVLAQLIRIQPLDHQAVALLIQEAQQNSLLARLGRGGQDLTAFGAFLATQKKWGSPWVDVMAGVAWGGPYIVSRLKGIDRPVTSNLEQLYGTWPVTLDPNQTATFHLFSALWPDNTPVTTFILSTGTAAVKVAQ